MSELMPPRPYLEWRTPEAERAEDAAYTFGYHLVLHCRDDAIATAPKDVSEETLSAVEKAVDTAMVNIMDLLEGYWKLESGDDHSVELVLSVRVHDSNDDVCESVEISPCKLDLPIGYWKWTRDREFR